MRLFFLLLISGSCFSQQKFTYQGHNLQMIHPMEGSIFYDTIIFNKAHDTAFIYRSGVWKRTSDVIYAEGDSTFVIGSSHNEFIHRKSRYDNYLNYKKYKGYYRARRYVRPISYYSGDYSRVYKPVNIRVFRYQWWYKDETEEASGINYITLNHAPTKKEIRALIFRTCKKLTAIKYLPDFAMRKRTT